MSSEYRMTRFEASAIDAERPLPHAVFTADGVLLANQGARILDAEQLAILRDQGWRRLDPLERVLEASLDNDRWRGSSADDGLRLTASRPAPLERTKALVADDLPLARTLLSDILAEQGVRRVIEAEDGRQAIYRFFNEAPNLVFLDIDMPRLDGLGALRQIRRWSPGAFICLVSASSTRENVQAARDHAVDGFLVKPFSVLNLKRVLSKYQVRADGA